MSNVLDFYTGEPYVERKPADLEKLSLDIFNEEVELVSKALAETKSTLNTLTFCDAEIMSEAAKNVPIRHLAKLVVELDKLVKMGRDMT